jgi:hypothetical protein
MIIGDFKVRKGLARRIGYRQMKITLSLAQYSLTSANVWPKTPTIHSIHTIQ